MMKTVFKLIFALLIVGNLSICAAQSPQADQFREPWKDEKFAIVLDTFEGNSIDWQELSSDPRVAAIIHRAAMGFKRDKKYFARRAKAKKYGYKWGSYYVGVPGNGVKQADFYLKMVKPKKDELLALDLESLDSKKFMNLEQAESFIKRIKEKTGRYPLVYGNYKVIEKISASIGKDEVFSKTPLWYARFRTELPDFPRATWDSYTLWQFSCEINCKPTQLETCPYLVPGTETDMDVNIYNGSVDELKKSWPFINE